VAIFLGLTFGFTWGFELLIRGLDPVPDTREYGYYVLGISWGPAVAALLTCWIRRQSPARLGVNWTANRWYLPSYLLPLLYIVPAYLVIWLAGLGSFGDRATFLTLTQHLGLARWPAPLATLGLIVILASVGWLSHVFAALGEEIGWRGLLLPELTRMVSFRGAALASGLVWSLWHVPVILFTDYNGGTPAAYGLLCFTATLVGISFPLAWLRLRSGTVWTAVIFHASHNLFILGLFNPLTGHTSLSRWFVGEFGAVVAIASLLVGALFAFGWPSPTQTAPTDPGRSVRGGSSAGPSAAPPPARR